MSRRFGAAIARSLPLMILVGTNVSATEQRLAALSFIEPMRGEDGAHQAYVARGPGYSAYLRADEALFVVSPGRTAKSEEDAPQATRRAAPLRMRLLGSRPAAEGTASEPLPGHSNHLRGRDQRRWQRGVPHYRSVRFDGVYPGIDVVYRLEPDGLRYDFVVGPHADPQRIRLRFDDGYDARIDERGVLRVRGDAGEFVQSAPVIYQELEGGRREIAGGFAADSDGALRFHVAGRDAERELVIDPTVAFATYLGGNAGDGVSATLVDAEGRVVVIGSTSSPDFPTVDPIQGAPAGGLDVYVARLAADGQSLEYATYLGGSMDDAPGPAAYDPDGNIVIGGRTYSEDFPVQNAAQPFFNGGSSGLGDAFVLKLAAAGDALVYSTFLGGSDPPPGSGGFLEEVRGLAVDAAGNAYVSGPTPAPDFPATHTLNGRACLADEVPSLASDVFIARFGAAGALAASTCIGGSTTDYGRSVALGPGGTIYVAGHTRSTDYPVTPGAYQGAMAGIRDIYVTRLNAAATTILYSTFVGGTGDEFAQQVRVGADAAAVVAGWTFSEDFPTTAGAFQPEFRGPALLNYGGDAFVFKLAGNGSNLVFSSYFGGGSAETGWGLDLDPAGRVFLAGSTGSADLPLATPTQPQKGALAGVVEQVGPPEDDKLALASGSILVSAVSRPILVAGNAGVDRAYLFENYFSPVMATVDLGTADHTRAVALFDADLDGQVDAIVTGNDDAPNRLYRSDGAGNFLPPVDIDPQVRPTRAIVVAQVRGSDTPDLIVGNHLEPNLLYPGTPAGFGAGIAAFPGSASTATTALAVGDLDRDGLADVVEGNDGQPLRVYLATANGFRPGAAIGIEADRTTSVAVGDVDGDADLDIVAGNLGASNRLYRNRGDATFDAEQLDAEPGSTSGVLLADVDYDGYLEVLTSDDDAGWVYRNDGTGHFARHALTSSADPSRAITQGLFASIAFRATPAGTSIHRLDVWPDDVYAAVLDATGSRLLFSTYVAGGGSDFINWGVDADGRGNLYLGLSASADDVPTVAALQSPSGAADGFVMKIVLDADADGLLDAEDNCTEIANADQRDTNEDGFGNVCDPDLNDDGIVNFADLGLMKNLFFGTDPDADLNGDGHVNFVDLATLKEFFFQAPGPSGVAPALAKGTAPAQPR